MTDLRDKVASILRDEARIDWNLEIPDDSAARLADAILALPGIAEALALKARQDQWMRDVLTGKAISRMNADGTVERIDPADFLPDPPTA